MDTGRLGATPTSIDTTGAGGRLTMPATLDPVVMEARAELRRQDDFYAVARTRWGLVWFAVLWLASTPIDLLACLGLGAGDLVTALLVRLIPLPFAGLFAHRLARSPMMTETQIFRAWAALDVVLVLWLSLFALDTGGMRSVVQVTALFVPLTMIIVPSPYQRSLVAYGLMLVTYTMTMLLGTYLAPAYRDQLHDRESWMQFALFFMVFNGMCASMTMVSHMLWMLRREVFESKSIGKYRLRRLLGRGGMGEVWAAYHAGLRREVAVKLVNAGDERAGTSARRFEREVQAMVSLTHPNTVRVFDFGVADGGLLYYAMELLEGEHLGRLVKREGPLPLARARHFALQASRALAEAHAHGIVHRDVKPENLFVTTAGGERDFLKVLDFGIALTTEADAAKLTQTGAVAGTPGTVSPEVIRGLPATPASDVYAMGSVLYLMVTGTLPFASDQVMSIMLAHLNDVPVPPSVRRVGGLPSDFEELVLRCLAKDPRERYVDARALAEALDRCESVGDWDPADAPRPDESPASSPPPGAEAPDARTRPLAVAKVRTRA